MTLRNQYVWHTIETVRWFIADLNLLLTKQTAWFKAIVLFILTATIVNTDSSAQTVQIGNGTANNAVAGITPFSTGWEDGRTQMIYLANELNNAGAPAGGSITSLALNFTGVGSPAPQNVQIRLGHTPVQNDLSSTKVKRKTGRSGGDFNFSLF